MRLTDREIAFLKEQMVQSSEKLNVFLNMDFSTSNRFELFIEHVSPYFGLQTDALYESMRVSHAQDPSSLKKVDFLQNDLKLLKVHLYEVYESLGQSNTRPAKATMGRKVRSLITQVRERLQLEENFLYPLMV